MVPIGWINATVGEIVSIKSKKADPAKLGATPFIGLEDVEPHTGRILNCGLASDVKSSVAKFEVGDILYGRLRPYLNKVISAPLNGCASAEMIVMTPAEGVDSRLIQLWLMSPAFLDYTSSLDQGDRPRVSAEDVAAYPVLVPPSREQRRIVTKLDALTTRLARAREELHHIIRLKKRFQLSALETAFRSFSMTGSVRLDEICRVGTGSTPKRGEARYYKSGTIPWVTSGVVNQDHVLEPTAFITEAAVKETNCKIFPAGSLLVALYGEGKTRGKVTRLGISAATNQALAALHDFDEKHVVPEWIKLFLEARYEITRSEAAGGVQPNLNLGIVKAIEIPLPNVAEQHTAIRSIKAAFDRADRLEAEIAIALKLVDRLESAILAKAFRGELVLQDPADEHASILLERIRAQRSSGPSERRQAIRNSASA